MALITCPECGAQVSENAKVCPKCGSPIEKKIVCSECGTVLTNKMRVCPKCGAPAPSNGGQYTSRPTQKSNSLSSEQKTVMAKLIAFTVLLLVFALLANIMFINYRTGFCIGGILSVIIMSVFASLTSKEWESCEVKGVRIGLPIFCCAVFLTYAIIYIINGVKLLTQLIESYYNYPATYWISSIVLLILCATYLYGIVKAAIVAYKEWSYSLEA